MLAVETAKPLTNESETLSNFPTGTLSVAGGGTTTSTATTTNTNTNTNAILTSVTLTPLRLKNQNSSKSNDEKPEKFDNALTIFKGKLSPKPPNEFYKDLYQFHEKRGTPIVNTPKISGFEMDLHRLYCEVTERGGFQKVNNRDEWDEILMELGMYEKCVNGTAALKYIYRRVLEKYERQNYFGEDPDKMDAIDGNDLAELGGRSGRMRYSSSLYSSTNTASIHNVPMSYNHRQHIVNMDRRRQFKLSTDIYKPSPYEKLMLSLLSPLPNEQDFAINACTLMTNEAKHTFRLGEYPKLLNALVAHAGVYSDCNMRKLFEHIYNGVRRHSLYAFWADLLHNRQEILDLFRPTAQTTPSVRRNVALVEPSEIHSERYQALQKECMELDFLNLGRGLGTQDYVGQRVLQVISILRNLSFFEENVPILAKNRTLLRFLVMSSNIRWNNIHIQALEITGNIATELELFDPSSDDISRNLMATLCDGVDCSDRSLIINSLEILYKLCQKDGNEEYVLKCLNFSFYQTLVQFLSLSDIMLLIFTLEAIYVLTSLGRKSCHIIMQVRGLIEQLVSLITVEAQSYGPNGCILMRVIETIPGNMLPIVAQNMANVQPSFPSPQTPILNRNHTNAVVIPASTPTPTPPPPPPPPPQPAVEVIADTPVTPCLESNTPPKQTQQNFIHDDEQYALTWLTNTCERNPIMDSHIEQQELYRMYLNHCQKSGKLSVVNHLQFPRLVSLTFGNGVGPMNVKLADGTELPGLHYVAIRLKSTTLPPQNKTNTSTNPTAISPKSNQENSVTTQRKVKKKIKPETGVLKNDQMSVTIINSNNVVEANNNIEIPAINQTKKEVPIDVGEGKLQLNISNKTNEGTQTILEACTSSHTPSSLIKSLLANKVNQRQQKQKDLSSSVIVSTNSPSAATNQITVVSVPSNTNPIIQPIKVASTAISALVNNPLMQNASVKVGQTTIKPLNPQNMNLEKKSINDSVPPPLAPLSGNNVTKDLSGRPMILSNQMLVDIIDKKFLDTSLTSNTTVIAHKRKQEDNGDNSDCKRSAFESNCIEDEQQATPSKNAANLYAEIAASILEEDDDLEDIPPITHPPQLITDQANLPTQSQPQQTTASILIPAKIQTQNPANTIQNVQRQLVFQNSPNAQLKLSQPTSSQSTQQIPNAMATIKTDQGLQTVPVILQQKPMDTNKPATQIIQQVIQQSNQPQQTQYVLATNQQGQTYLVAQQQPAPQSQATPPPPPPTQTVLVTQTPHQQSTGAKTIIILQQQSLTSNQQQIITNTAGGGQKVLMTTPQGQQVLVTQRPQTPQQIFINPQTGTATHIQHMPVNVPASSAQTAITPRQIIQTSQHMQQIQQLQQIQQIQQPQQITAGQISPSLLNQLNQIPATIKLHQPAPVQTQPSLPQATTISRMNKALSIVPAGSGSVVSPVTIPQLQQHQSIIQQHIITGPPAEKRHVILGGGRAIEIKETVITSTQTPAQQCQLNSQTIITRQTPSPAPSPVPTPPLLQPQQTHSSIVQQKISMPLLQVTSTPALIAPKATEPANVHAKALIPANNFVATQAVVQTVLPCPLNAVANTVTTVKKQPLPLAMTAAGVNSALIKSNLAVVPKVSTPVSNTGPPPLTMSSTATTNNPNIQMHKTMQPKDIIKESSTKDEAIKSTNFTTSTSSSTSSSSPTSSTSSITTPSQTTQKPPSTTQQQTLPNQQLSTMDMQWLYICDWRNCPRQKFKSLNDLQHHVCNVHVPDHLDIAAEIFCQWGVGPGLCDGIPRKRFSLMTHLIERHLTYDCLRAAAQRRIATGLHNLAPTKPPVTIVRNLETSQKANNNNNNATSASPTSTNSSGNTSTVSGLQQQQQQYTAMQAIKRRYTSEFMNANELIDENEGPVTKSIRLTAALILRNLVTNSSTAKRYLRRYESHLANIALSNVESSATISHILYELNN